MSDLEKGNTGESEYYTVMQISERMGVTRTTVINWIKEGMPCYKISRKYYIPKEEFDIWLERTRMPYIKKGSRK